MEEIGISSHVKDPVARVVINFHRVVFSNAHGFFMIYHCIGCIPNSVACFLNARTPVPLFIIQKEFLWEHPYPFNHFSLYQHGAAMSAMRGTGYVELPIVWFTLANRGGSAREVIHWIEAGVLNNAGLIPEPDFGTGHTNIGMTKKRLN